VGACYGPAVAARRTASWLLPLLAASLACGYTIERASSAVSPDAPRLSIRTLANDSAEPGLERLVSEALRREWSRRGHFRLVGDPEDADWVVSGRVLPLMIQTRTLSSAVLALEQTVTLRVELDVTGRQAGALRAWRLPGPLSTESEIYFASADLEATRKNRTEALRRVAELVAERVADAISVEVGS
jgi:hypothetical protein